MHGTFRQHCAWHESSDDQRPGLRMTALQVFEGVFVTVASGASSTGKAPKVARDAGIKTSFNPWNGLLPRDRIELPTRGFSKPVKSIGY